MFYDSSWHLLFFRFGVSLFKETMVVLFNNIVNFYLSHWICWHSLLLTFFYHHPVGIDRLYMETHLILPCHPVVMDMMCVETHQTLSCHPLGMDMMYTETHITLSYPPGGMDMMCMETHLILILLVWVWYGWQLILHFWFCSFNLIFYFLN